VVRLTAEADARPKLEPESSQLPIGRSCHCLSSDVKAYREDGEWICHTCGHRLSPHASTLLTLRTNTPMRGDSKPRGRGDQGQPTRRERT
jgi:hypothetical protein